MTDSPALEEVDDVVYEPADDVVEESNVYEFMQKHGIF